MTDTAADRGAAERAAQGHRRYVTDPARLSRIAEIVRNAQDRQPSTPAVEEVAA